MHPEWDICKRYKGMMGEDRWDEFEQFESVIDDLIEAAEGKLESIRYNIVYSFIEIMEAPYREGGEHEKQLGDSDGHAE